MIESTARIIGMSGGILFLLKYTASNKQEERLFRVIGIFMMGVAAAILIFV